jgi:hypothetical protein
MNTILGYINATPKKYKSINRNIGFLVCLNMPVVINLFEFVSSIPILYAFPNDTSADKNINSPK